MLSRAAVPPPKTSVAALIGMTSAVAESGVICPA